MEIDPLLFLIALTKGMVALVALVVVWSVGRAMVRALTHLRSRVRV